MRTLRLYIALFAVILLFSFCKSKEVRSRVRVMDLYRKPLLEESIDVSTGITSYELKFTNKHAQKVIIPFTYNRWLPIMQSFTGKITRDSITEIYSRGTTYHRSLGLDTLMPGETQRYFVNISNEAAPSDKHPIIIISFQYYYLDDFIKSEYSTEYVKQESFILWKSDSLIITYPTNFGFNPNFSTSHILP